MTKTKKIENEIRLQHLISVCLDSLKGEAQFSFLRALINDEKQLALSEQKARFREWIVKEELMNKAWLHQFDKKFKEEHK